MQLDSSLLSLNTMEIELLLLPATLPGEEHSSKIQYLSIQTDSYFRIKIRHSYCHDNSDFIPVLSAIQNLPISLVVADKGNDDEKNHQFIRECLLADSINPARFADISIWKTRGKYRKSMKRGYIKLKPFSQLSRGCLVSA